MTTLIPVQLKEERFLRLQYFKEDKQKAALEKGWPTKTNYTLKNFIKKFPEDPSYGVLCGHNNLMVIDCDDKETQDQLIQNPIFTETFTTKTAGKGLYHFYFRVILREGEEPKGFRADNKAGERIFDLQGLGTYVVGPGSKLLDERTYDIVNSREIASITYQELTTILKNLIPGTQIIDVKTKKKLESPMLDFDDVCAAIKSKLTISDILPENIKTEDGVNTNCPVGHKSVGGQCFSHNGFQCNCFHCGFSGNIFQLYQKMHGVTFIEAKRALAKQAGLEDDLKSRFMDYYMDQKKRYKAVDLLSRELLKMNKIYTIRGDKTNEMWIYKNGIYVPYGQTYIIEFVKSIMGPGYTKNFATKVANDIESLSFVLSDDFFTNEDKNLIPVLNGILNIKTKTITQFSPDYRFFNKLPIVFDPIQKPEKTIAFMKDILKDEETITLLQEIFGYCLLRENLVERAFMFIGSGRNGKSKLLDLMNRFVGYQNSLNLTLQDLSKSNSYDTEKLFGKYINIGGDIPNTKLKDSSRLKALVSREPVTHMRKFMPPISFANHAKLLFACNELPDVDDSSDGFFDKWVKIDFPYKFVIDPTLPHHKKIDIGILDNISTQEEMSGLMNWSLEGLERVLKNKDFTETEENRMTQKSWQKISSSMAYFIEEEIEAGTFQDKLTLADFNMAYNNFCFKHKLKKDKMKVRKEKWENAGMSQSTQRHEGTNTRIFQDFKFKNKENIQEVEKEPEETEINLEEMK